ncbi:Hypothetical predicted protein [Mytilus galloprovincialis]|uniref:Reverse transcriptase domain-containing protein n=1 Tax=Mytilus galloprovincialis TaxID=29158 RepID=A0A8B6F140_MYTGA|nr:Hypothetical predicted protein [Mytilus galloprovincialis]
MAGRPRDQENIHFRNMKNGKRKLRSTQRQLEAVARKQKFENIMTAREGDQKLFFKLVNDQRRTGMEKTTQLKFKNGIYDNPDSIRKGWAEYFEELATPSSSNYEDVLYNNQVELDCLLFEDTYISNLQNSEKISVTEEQVEKVINTLKSGKAADCANLTSEHLKNGGQIVISAVTKLINMIFDVCSIPDLLKLGIATPVYKRKGKPLDDPNSYRKITVTSILNKILEKLYLEKKDETLKNAQSPLQRGFTKGISGLNAALILNELIAEAQDLHRPLYVAFLDAQKAFDLVWHSSLLRKLHQSGIESDSWLMFKEWYKDLTSQIKWEGELSKVFSEHQGVRQGGVTSPAAYKLFINPMLDHIETQNLGSYIGPIYCGTPTVADDVCLVSNNPEDLQAMLDIQGDYANKEHYLYKVKQNHLWFNLMTNNLGISP